jgi:hypothetical protein
MKISVKDFAVNMQLGNNGITLDVYDNDDTFRGDVRLGKATIEWCRGKAHSGYKVNWNDFIAWIEANGKKG